MEKAKKHQTKKHIREAYNAKTYRRFGLRVRRGTELCEKLDAVAAEKGPSLNHLITTLLCQHYNLPYPDPQAGEA